MTLNLIPSESYAIAMRHLDHKLDTESGFIANTIKPLIAIPNQYTYVKKNLMKLLTNIDKLREEIREDSTKTDKREVILQAKLSEIEVKYKNIVNKSLIDFVTQAEKLRVLRTKLDNIIAGLDKLLSYPLKDGVMESIQNKREKVSNLNDPIPTMANISTILRIEELQNQALVARWTDLVVRKAAPIFSEGESDNGTIDKVLASTEEEISSEIYSLAYNLCKPILEPNDDSLIFLNSTLKQSVAKFVSATRNRNQVKNQAIERLAELSKKKTGKEAAYLEQQVAILDKFTQKLGNQLAEVPHYFEERAMETGGLSASLGEHPEFKFYQELTKLVVIELTSGTSDSEVNSIYDKAEELYDMVNQKINLDHFATHLSETLAKAAAVKKSAELTRSTFA